MENMDILNHSNQLNYNVISSGSVGNCVVIDDIMIDCGVPYTKIKEELYNIKYLLITHIHGDHVRKSTLNYIKRNFPNITIISNYDVHQVYGVDIVANAGYEIYTDDYVFNCFECVHDVVTYGYYWNHIGLDIIYATDTSNMNFAPQDMKFDYLFLESNHDEKKLEAVRERTKNLGYDAYAGGKRHLSTQKSREYYFVNRRDKDSEHIELHKSSRFY